MDEGVAQFPLHQVLIPHLVWQVLTESGIILRYQLPLVSKSNLRWCCTQRRSYRSRKCKQWKCVKTKSCIQVRKSDSIEHVEWRFSSGECIQNSVNKWPCEIGTGKSYNCVWLRTTESSCQAHQKRHYQNMWSGFCVGACTSGFSNQTGDATVSRNIQSFQACKSRKCAISNRCDLVIGQVPARALSKSHRKREKFDSYTIQSVVQAQ